MLVAASALFLRHEDIGEVNQHRRDAYRPTLRVCCAEHGQLSPTAVTLTAEYCLRDGRRTRHAGDRYCCRFALTFA